MSKLLCTTAPPATLLVRFSVGAVFLSEGMQKFLFADAQGAGRFAKIGIPAPDIMGPLRWLHGDCLRRVTAHRIADSARCNSAHDRHFCSDYFNEGADPAWSRILEIQSAEIGELRFLEHGARGAHGFLHVARQSLSSRCRRRKKVVARRAADSRTRRGNRVMFIIDQ